MSFEARFLLALAILLPVALWAVDQWLNRGRYTELLFRFVRQVF